MIDSVSVPRKSQATEGERREAENTIQPEQLVTRAGDFFGQRKQAEQLFPGRGGRRWMLVRDDPWPP